MVNKIDAAIQAQASISTSVKEKVTEMFTDNHIESWTSKLVTKTPFCVFQVRNLINPNSWIFQDLENTLSNDDFAVAIFNTANKDITDYKFALIHSVDFENDSIECMKENDDGTLQGTTSISSDSFLNSYTGYQYAFSFVLNDQDIFPTFEIIDFSTSTNEEKTFSLRDLLSYLYYCYPEPLFETDQYKVNIFGIRSNYGYYQDNADGGTWKYERRETMQDYFILTWIEDGDWKLKIYPGTTFPDEYYYEKDWDRVLNKKTNKHYKSIGLGIVIPGQHQNAYKIGKHGYKKNDSSYGYKALKQCGTLQHYRDRTPRSDSTYYEFDKNSRVYNNEHDGWGDYPAFNLHTTATKSGGTGKSIKDYEIGDSIGKFSQGCQVIAMPKGNKWNEEIMKIFKKQKSATDKKTFTYTIIEEWDFLKYMEKVNGED